MEMNRNNMLATTLIFGIPATKLVITGACGLVAAFLIHAFLHKRWW